MTRIPTALAACLMLSLTSGLVACANDGPKSPASRPRPASDAGMAGMENSGMTTPTARVAAAPPPVTTKSVSPDGQVVETTTSSTFSSEAGGTVNGVPVDPSRPYQGRSAQLPTFSSLTIVDPSNPPPRAQLPQAVLPVAGTGVADDVTVESTTHVTEETATAVNTPESAPMTGMPEPMAPDALPMDSAYN